MAVNKFIEVRGFLINPAFVVCISSSINNNTLGKWKVLITMMNPYNEITVECQDQQEATDLMMDIASQLND